MNARAFLLALSVVLACAAAHAQTPAPAAAKPAPTSAAGATSAPKPVTLPLSPRFKQVRERIDALYQHRNEPPAPLDARENPFRPAGPLRATGKADAGKPQPLEVLSDLALLEQAAATLKVSGVFEFGGRTQLVINGRPYREGDTVPAQVRGETIQVRVRTILRRSVAFALNNAELTVKF